MNKAAQTLGRMAAGHPKHFGPAELERRANRMRIINTNRRLAALERKRAAESAPEIACGE